MNYTCFDWFFIRCTVIINGINTYLIMITNNRFCS
ncbi:hypothetical protein CoNPh35_CDS0031 [Staphylococcus phage S-CoN_Ph35]|nr:hypothetical protein CoNPh35_CDS0031 [Staphylococcus phage S-CoN_Ph35]